MQRPSLEPTKERRSGGDRRTAPERRSGQERRARGRRTGDAHRLPTGWIWVGGAAESSLPFRRLFPQARSDEREAADRALAIEAHGRQLNARVGRNLGLLVAALDYLGNISHELVSPTIVERGALEVLERRSVTDPLTGLFNRFHFEATLTREVARSARSATWLALLLMDVDHLKKVNDRLGHQAGDGVLKGVAAAIRESLRTADTAARYGGDEFAVILPDTDTGAGRLVAERIRMNVAASLGVEIVPGAPAQGTVSVGLAALSAAGSSTAEALLLLTADRALYVAKGRGGNCVGEEV
jgi:diguanylate cyclase (GGDEF)-like protein